MSVSRLPMSGSWGSLFSAVVVKAFDEHSLTIQYGVREVVVTLEDNGVKLDESGKNYTSFELYIAIKNTEAESSAFRIVHNEQFLRCFRTKERVMRLTKDDVDLLCKEAQTGDSFAEYGYGRWLYYNQPDESAMSEAEQLFLSSKKYVPDALAAYALMWRYGETKADVMDIEESDKLLRAALKRGSERAAQQLARHRIFGLFCEEEPEAVAREIEKRLSETDDCDPQWHSLLAFAYEKLGRKEDAIQQYEQSTAQGELDDYFYLAYIYKERGNMALYESLMEEGIERGSGLCCVYLSDTDEKDYQELSGSQRLQFHERVDRYLQQGLSCGEGFCAYYLWYHNYYGCLGYNDDQERPAYYLKQGVRLGNVSCMLQMAELADEGEWPEEMSQYDIAELRLRAARFSPADEDTLSHLRRVSEPAFLLKHKRELEKYWHPLFTQLLGDDCDDDDGRYDAWA